MVMTLDGNDHLANCKNPLEVHPLLAVPQPYDFKRGRTVAHIGATRETPDPPSRFAAGA